MGKYNRIDPRLAADPAPRMRLFGRSPKGVLWRFRVLTVERGNVYGWMSHRCAGTRRLRTPVDSWRDQFFNLYMDGLIIAVRVPKVEVAHVQS